jgi:hypothetical protein
MIGVGLTTDGWSGEQKLKYHTLTSHGVVCLIGGSSSGYEGQFLHPNFVLSTTAFLEGDDVNVGLWIATTTDLWLIDWTGTRIVGLSLDGGECGAAREAKIHFIWCASHTINLAIHDVTQIAADRVSAPPSYYVSSVCYLLDQLKKDVIGYFKYPPSSSHKLT